ncbi:MAG TPA: hypothetical protein VIN09_01810 [Chloroflexota bacterium]
MEGDESLPVLIAAAGQRGRRPAEAIRVCAGDCPYFQPVFQNGRKRAGQGLCLHDNRTTTVGTLCQWELDQRSQRHRRSSRVAIQRDPLKVPVVGAM